MIRIRKKHKQIFLRVFCCLLCASVVITAVLSVPVIARVIPDSVCGLIAAGIMKNEYKELLNGFTDRYVRPEYYAECVPVSLSAVLGYDYEEETQPVIPEGVELVSARDLCGYNGSPQFLLSNQTKFTVSPPDGGLPFAFPKDATEPVVLIIHTHGTESYAAEGQTSYTEGESFRDTDIGGNVVAVGAVMADTFAAAGIPVLHCLEMFDRESYSDAYVRSAAAVREYLAEHPSIRIVLDVHRDSINRSDKTKIRPVTDVNGADTAQFMIVTGTDFKGANHPDWQDNLNFALKIQSRMTEVSDRLCRAVNLRGAGFNQQYASGSLILEIGSCGNTLTEAKRTAVWAAAAIADTVTAIPCGITPEDILT